MSTPDSNDISHLDESSTAMPQFSSDSNTSSLLTCRFNQDGGCLAVGTTSGFSVHNLHPAYGLSVERELRGGLSVIEMLFRCNLMALVGGGPSPHSAPHRVLIWDDHVGKEIGELSFRQTVLSVKLRKDAICVALRDRIYVYNLSDLSLRDKIYTADNPNGLLSLSTNISDMVLACPSVSVGQVRVELYGLRKTMLVEAHDSMLRALALTADGTKLATASFKGTVIRVFDTHSNTAMHEFRRGVERATITCLAWSNDQQWLACTSDKGTAHVFYMEPEESDTTGRENGTSPPRKPKKSLTKRMWSSVKGSVLQNSGEKKSICQVRGVPHPLACAFSSDGRNILSVAGWDADGNGVLLVSEFVAHQEARRIAYHVLVKSSSTEQETEEETRRRRLRGWTPQVPVTDEGEKLVVGSLQDGLQGISFDENGDFVTISSSNPTNGETINIEEAPSEHGDDHEDNHDEFEDAEQQEEQEPENAEKSTGAEKPQAEISQTNDDDDIEIKDPKEVSSQ